MALLHKYAKYVWNGILFVLLSLILVLALLNLVNPGLPALQCVGNEVKDPRISFKYTGDTVTTLKLFFFVVWLPYFQILVTEYFCNKENLYTSNANESSRWKRTFLTSGRWFRDYFYGFAVVFLLNDVAKTTLNSPRPHFLESCKPSFAKDACQLGWVYDYECTNTDISRWRLADARKSFPSGHSVLSFYAAWFMVIYQHRRISQRVTGTLFVLWLHLFWFAYAVFCSVSRVADKRHHPIDAATGALLGSLGGIFSALILTNNFSHRESGNLPLHYNGNKVNANGGTPGPPNGPLANGGPPRSMDKRPSLRRLLSTQSTVTQMSDIAEDRELDNL